MRLLTFLEGELSSLLNALGAPEPLRAACGGAFRTTGWVVAVMLPPMAIFFPLFTLLLEDVGFLPRLAFNVDRCFRRSQSCGKH